MRLAKFKISASLGFLQKGTYVLNTLVKTDPHMKSNKYTIYHEICIYAKSPHPNSVFCLNLEFFYHLPPFRMVESPPD